MPKRMVVALYTAAFTLLMPVMVASAQLATLSAGVRIRLRAPGVLAGSVDGIVVGQRSDTLLFAPLNRIPAAAPVAVPFAAISEARQFRGKSGRAGFKRGALLGGGIGLALGLMDAGLSDCGEGTCSSRSRLGASLSITALGVGIGGAIGASRGAERWERVRLP